MQDEKEKNTPKIEPLENSELFDSFNHGEELGVVGGSSGTDTNTSTPTLGPDFLDVITDLDIAF